MHLWNRTNITEQFQVFLYKADGVVILLIKLNPLYSSWVLVETTNPSWVLEVTGLTDWPANTVFLSMLSGVKLVDKHKVNFSATSMLILSVTILFLQLHPRQQCVDSYVADRSTKVMSKHFTDYKRTLDLRVILQTSDCWWICFIISNTMINLLKHSQNRAFQW